MGYCQGGVIAYELACLFESKAMRLILSASSMRLRRLVKREIPGLLSSHRLSVIKNSLPFWWKDYRELGHKRASGSASARNFAR